MINRKPRIVNQIPNLNTPSINEQPGKVIRKKKSRMRLNCLKFIDLFLILKN